MGVNEVSAGRYNALLNKLLAMEETVPAPTLAPEIIPSLVLESQRPEWDHLAQSRRIGGSANQSGGVATNAHVGLLNPSKKTGAAWDSGVVAVIEMCAVRSSVAAPFGVGYANTVPTMGGANYQESCDRRYSGVGSCILSRVNAVPQLDDRIYTFYLPAVNTDYELPITPFVVPQGTYLLIIQDTVNQGMDVQMTWRERAIEPSELKE